MFQKLGIVSDFLTTSSLFVARLTQVGSRFVFQVRNTGSTALSVIPKAIVTGRPLTAAGLRSIHYRNVESGADVVAGTAITQAMSDQIWDLIADGCDIYLSIDWTDGVVDIFGNEVMS